MRTSQSTSHEKGSLPKVSISSCSRALRSQLFNVAQPAGRAGAGKNTGLDALCNVAPEPRLDASEVVRDLISLPIEKILDGAAETLEALGTMLFMTQLHDCFLK
jgi:hypothetical protein